MLVFAFDRDWTVDVNPHPSHDAVPLDWVRHLAHDTEHAVYAIGNQQLAEEAAIPGVVDIVGRHPDAWDDWLGDKQPNGRYEQFPTRRDRLSLITDLHPAADRYIVVDDLDLSDADGWDHYHAWEFIPAVERGDIHPGLPWTDPLPDGGLPSVAGTTPANASQLASFLTDYADADGYELLHTADGPDQTTLLYELSPIRKTLSRAVQPVFRCTPLNPGDEEFTLTINSIEHLSVVDLPAELYTKAADTPSEEVTGLRRLAETKPNTVNVASLLQYLEHDDETITKEAMNALRHVAAVRPEDCLPAIPSLSSRLRQSACQSPADALAILRHIAEAEPGEIAPLADEITPHLTSADDTTRRNAAQCIAKIAATNPEDVVETVPALSSIVTERVDGYTDAVHALSHIADEFPDHVQPASDQLGDVLLDESLSDTTRLHASVAIGRIVSESPGVELDLVDDVVTVLDADNFKLRNNAMALLSDIALVHTDVIKPHVDTITPKLTDDDTYTRVNASATLARVANDFPNDVEHLTSTFVELLADDDPQVRENACWALGYLRATDATADLEATVADDESADVRTRASWALGRIDRSQSITGTADK